jgi:hypothetical protein
MRKSLWIVAVMFAAIVAPNAHATPTDYTINFTQTFGVGSPPTGTVVFDSTADSISMTILWQGYTFSFPDGSLAGLLTDAHGHLNAGPACGGADAQAVFNVLSGCVSPQPLFWVANGLGGHPCDISFTIREGGFGMSGESDTPIECAPIPGHGEGTLRLTPTPEPGTILSLGSGLLLLGLWLKQKMKYARTYEP